MGYHVIDPNEIDPAPDRPSEMRYISEAVGLQNLGLRVYAVAPGETIPKAGLHYHERQEEVFYVAEGEIRVETPDREYVIKRGQFFIVEPGNPHRAFNSDDATETARVVAFGAPAVNDSHPSGP